jgi:hypothetical protein
MTLHQQDDRLPDVPRGAVAGELVTALCYFVLGLFLPIGHWVSWPDLLVNWHFAVIVIGSLGLAAALRQRRPTSVKVALVLAAYIGLPSLLTLGQVIGSAHSSLDRFSYFVLGLGMFGQVLVLWSCLARLAPSR